MPAIAPVGSPLFWEWLELAVAAAVDEVDEDELVDVDADAVKADGVAVLSEGKSSPGCSINLEFLAPSFCVCRGVVALGLITPTIW